MKKRKYFKCKKRDYIAYNYLKNKKIVAILKDINKNNDIQRKKQLFPKSKKEPIYFFIIYIKELIL